MKPKESRKKGKVEQKQFQDRQEIINKIPIKRPSLSVITLIVKGLNSPIKRHKIAEMINKNQT